MIIGTMDGKKVYVGRDGRLRDTPEPAPRSKSPVVLSTPEERAQLLAEAAPARRELLRMVMEAVRDPDELASYDDPRSAWRDMTAKEAAAIIRKAQDDRRNDALEEYDW